MSNPPSIDEMVKRAWAAAPSPDHWRVLITEPGGRQELHLVLTDAELAQACHAILARLAERMDVPPVPD